jgi:hypothetical protein
VIVVDVHHDGDDGEVDKFAVVAAADRTTGENVVRRDGGKCRCRWDFHVGVHRESNAHSNRNPRVHRTKSNLNVVDDSCDVDTKVDENGGNSNRDRIRNSFEIHKTAIQYVDKNDIHAWLPYESVRWHCVDAGQTETKRYSRDSMLTTT